MKNTLNSRRNKLTSIQYINVFVFINGFLIMLIELTGIRLLSIYTGNTFYVWCNIIGTIMTSMSLGYWYGGKIKQKKITKDHIIKIYFFTAISIGILFFSYKFILKSISLLHISTPLKSLFGSLLLFSLPTFFISYLIPILIRLKIRLHTNIGIVTGKLMAIGTLGSIIGSFVTGYIIIPLIGPVQTFFSVFLLIVFILSVVRPKFLFYNIENLTIALSITAFYLWSFIIKKPEYQEFDTQYNHVRIIEKFDSLNRPIKIWCNNLTVHSAIYSDTLYKPAMSYINDFIIAEYLVDPINNALLIGGAGLVFPMGFSERNPKAKLDIVEIDPMLTHIATKYFDYESHPNHYFSYEDGRIFLDKTTKKYDAIYIDAFKDNSVPFHLVTMECVSSIFNRLHNNGVVILHFITCLKNQLFINRLSSTFNKKFQHIFIIPVIAPKNITIDQSFYLIAQKKPVTGKEQITACITNYFGYLPVPVKLNDTVFTDDFAPVEYMAFQK